MMPGTQDDWTTAPLIALDLEGSGAQDRDNEAILEIAVVPIIAGQPDVSAAYSTLINPGRKISRRPWISSGLTTAVLATAPNPAEVEPELNCRVNGCVVVGHNVGVDWRLLHRRYPAIAPAALIDTLRLARHLRLGSKNSLSALIAQLELTSQVERLAAGSQPHRALWDTVATALLLPALIARCWPSGVTLGTLLEAAAIDLATAPAQSGEEPVQETLFGRLTQPGEVRRLRPFRHFADGRPRWPVQGRRGAGTPWRPACVLGERYGSILVARLCDVKNYLTSVFTILAN